MTTSSPICFSDCSATKCACRTRGEGFATVPADCACVDGNVCPGCGLACGAALACADCTFAAPVCSVTPPDCAPVCTVTPLGGRVVVLAKGERDEWNNPSPMMMKNAVTTAAPVSIG